MKQAVLSFLLCAAIASHAQRADGGGDMRIALFSATPPASVVVEAAGLGAWWASCETCTHHPLTGALHMPAIPEVIAGGPLSVLDDVHGQVRTANGQWHLRAGKDRTIHAVLVLPSERYVAAVLMGQAIHGESIESLRAEAVIARTIALGSSFPQQGKVSMASDACDSAACQAIKLGPVSEEVSAAVRSTAGETLWFGAKRAQFLAGVSRDKASCLQYAAQMARGGRGYRDLLAFCFPGTTVRIRRADNGWQRASRGGLHAISTGTDLPALLDEATQAWTWARAHFSPRQDITPTVVLTPTTELFRQFTSQPGWQLASTSGSTVVLQPVEVLAANRASLAGTLQHELLHVVVEASADEKTPLWLREGLVEVLAGDSAASAPTLSASETERLLRSSGNRQESEAAHQAASARTRRLVERYGLLTVRGWLSTGASLPSE